MNLYDYGLWIKTIPDTGKAKFLSNKQFLDYVENYNKENDLRATFFNNGQVLDLPLVKVKMTFEVTQKFTTFLSDLTDFIKK